MWGASAAMRHASASTCMGVQEKGLCLGLGLTAGVPLPARRPRGGSTPALRAKVHRALAVPAHLSGLQKIAGHQLQPAAPRLKVWLSRVVEQRGAREARRAQHARAAAQQAQRDGVAHRVAAPRDHSVLPSAAECRQDQLPRWPAHAAEGSLTGALGAGRWRPLTLVLCLRAGQPTGAAGAGALLAACCALCVQCCGLLLLAALRITTLPRCRRRSA